MNAVISRVEERIRSLVRADYDDINEPQFPEYASHSELRFFRISELARFWDGSQAGNESLAGHQRRLITSLYGLSRPWTYAILGESGAASIYLGIPCHELEAKSWEQSLAAQLPGSSWRFDPASSQILQRLIQFPIVAALSGNPSLVPPADSQPMLERQRPSLDSLFEAMAGSSWAYIVMARPRSELEVRQDLRGVEEELQETMSSHRRRGSAEESNSPLVSRYIGLLESTQRKLLEGTRNGMWDVQTYLLTENALSGQRGTQALYSAFGGPDSYPQPLRIKSCHRNVRNNQSVVMTTRLTSSEVSALAGLPCREVAGLQVTEYVAFGLASGDCNPSACDLALGTVMSGATNTARWFEISKDGLDKHLFVAGVPGSGKTRTCLYLLHQLWQEQHTPWLVLEPSLKSEYRALLRSSLGADLRIFTAGDEAGSPLRLNPLEVLDGVHVQTHIGGVLTLFKAAFAMEAPMPYVLDEAVHRVYEERGWDLVSGKHPSSTPECQPTLGELLETCERVVNDLGYDRQLTANLQAAMRTRISSLLRGAKGCMLNVRKSIPMEYLLAAPTVIEFSAIGDDDEKAFLLGCVLLKLSQYRQSQGLSQVGLQHVTLLEEAHRLLRNVSETAGTSVANPRRAAIESFSNLLAEFRALGEGLVVVDQMPSKLIPDVIRNTGLKIVHRLTADEERKIVGGAMALTEAQIRFLSCLTTGQAIVYSDGCANACRVCVPDHAGREGYLRDYPSRAEIRAHMQHLVSEEVAVTSSTIAPPPTLRGANPPTCSQACLDTPCSTRTRMADYVSRHALNFSPLFRKAMTEGFDALWRLGVRINSELGAADVHPLDGPVCAVLTVADAVGLADSDMQVLRRNMERLRNKQANGGKP